MRYVKGNAVYNGRDIVVGDVRIINPTEQLTEAGWVAQQAPLIAIGSLHTVVSR